ncbi:MAG: hypothetical protein PVH99_17180, partial [Desulfobacteraceae bacterium]
MSKRRKEENIARVGIEDKPTPLNALVGCELFAPKRMILKNLSTCDKMDGNKALKRFYNSKNLPI